MGNTKRHDMSRSEKARRASRTSAINRALAAIRRRQLAGETAETSRELARLFDKVYGTGIEARFHGGAR